MKEPHHETSQWACRYSDRDGSIHAEEKREVQFIVEGMFPPGQCRPTFSANYPHPNSYLSLPWPAAPSIYNGQILWNTLKCLPRNREWDGNFDFGTGVKEWDCFLGVKTEWPWSGKHILPLLFYNETLLQNGLTIGGTALIETISSQIHLPFCAIRANWCHCTILIHYFHENAADKVQPKRAISIVTLYVHLSTALYYLFLDIHDG